MVEVKNYQIDLNGFTLKFVAPNNDQTWGGTIAGLAKGEFNFSDLSANPGDVILDIGCNIGLVSLFCAKIYPQCQVHAYDPCEWAIQCLEKSREINSLSNLYIHHSCITASTNDYIEFSHESLGPSCFVRSDLTTKEGHSFSGYKVKNTHIADIINQKIAFMKMDIEGGEYEIFEWLFNNLPNFSNKVDRVHIELHRTKGMNTDLLEERLSTAFQNTSSIIKV